MNMFTMPLNNKRRLARDDGPSSGPSAAIVRVDDERAKSLLRERDAKVAALEKEVVGLRNRLATLSREAGAVGGGARRRGGKELTPYGNTVRVSYSKCSAKRKQVSGRHDFLDFSAITIHTTLPPGPAPAAHVGAVQDGPQRVHIDAGRAELAPGPVLIVQQRG